MKIALIGYGKMGKAIEECALEKGHQIVARVKSSTDKKGWEEAKTADAAIEFTRPDAVVKNLMKCFELNIPVITGTTGWYADFEHVSQLCRAENATFFYATNFSIGVNIFWEVNKRLAAIMNSHSDYSVKVDETHHIHKLDAPSGTAITTAEQIVHELDRVNGWKEETSINSGQDNLLLIRSHREGEVPGTHVVCYENEVDSIELKHVAKSRKGFALGAVAAAEWVGQLQAKGVYTMKDMLRF